MTPPKTSRITIEARAKLNLMLAVGPLRDDRFHELVTVFQSISLADTLIVEPRPRGFSLVVRHEDASLCGGTPGRRRRAGASGARRGDRTGVPRGADNLVLRAARAVAEALRLGGGARFTLVKRIPAGAGLGGGSADAAAVLRALPQLYGMRLAPACRVQIAAALGSDVPFAVSGGTALGRGRGERLTPIALRAPFRALLAVPAWRISTPLAYARINPTNDLTSAA